MGIRGMESLKYNKEDSLRSSFSRGSLNKSKRKIGGLARRIMLRQSTQRALEYKKNMSLAAQSLYDGDSPERAPAALPELPIEIEMARASNIGSHEI